MTRPLLAVIPCRGGSKRIPRKWSALVAGKPLLQHTIDTAQAADGIDRLVVCTEDPAIASYARLRGVDVIDRPAHLAGDDVPLADVVRFVATECDDESDIVILQPTCPLLKPATIDLAVETFRMLKADWMISASKDPHIFWRNGQPIVPRLQSQQLAEGPEGLWRESGAIQIMTADFARTQLGRRSIFPIPADEALDIDTYADLEAARAAVSKRNILFHVVASDEKGSGHLRRCLQLSDALSHHDVAWSPNRLEAWAIDEAMRHGMRWVETGAQPDLVVLDVLDDADSLTSLYAAEGIPTVVFEPDGATRARRFADLVIDEFSEPSLTILRPEFLCLPPYKVRERPERVLVTFGGTDPAGMNDRVSRLLHHGADVLTTTAMPHFKVQMAEAMSDSDLVITSQGRTVHEAAAVGVPCLSIAVNERESRHAQLPGVIYLGLAHTLSDAAILDAANRLLGSPALRREMSATSSRTIDGRGLSRVVRKIEELLSEHE